MWKSIIFILSLCLPYVANSQTFKEIEKSIELYSFLLEAPKVTAREIISDKLNLKNPEKEIIEGALFEVYTDPYFGCIVHVGYSTTLFHHKEDVCRFIFCTFFYNTSKVDEFRKYLNDRSVFKKIGNSYEYLASENMILAMMKESGYRIILEVSELPTSGSQPYALQCFMTMKK